VRRKRKALYSKNRNNMKGIKKRGKRKNGRKKIRNRDKRTTTIKRQNEAE
jgi:hypothetical protein